MSTLPRDLLPYRWIAPLVVIGAVVLVPWTLVLAYRLPARHTTQHWDVAWVGFYTALAAALAATGWAVARRSEWAPPAAAVGATLLFYDLCIEIFLENS